MGNKHQIAGTLSIISGVLGLLGSILSFFAAFILQFALNSSDYYTDLTPDEQAIATGVILFFAIAGLLLSILAIIGGAFSLQRKVWGLTLTGAIASILVFFPTGIPAVIFVAMSRNEFFHNSPHPPSSTQTLTPSPPSSPTA